MVLPVAKRILAAGQGGPAPASDRLELSYEQRWLRRRRLETVSGASLLIDLPEAVSLSHGDRLALEDGRQIEIAAAPEALLEIRGEPLARLAWHIGNRHTPCEVQGDRLLIQRDHVLEDMLRKLGAETRAVTEPFQPEGGAYGHGRTHGHSHSHDPHADPDAHLREHSHD